MHGGEQRIRPWTWNLILRAHTQGGQMPIPFLEPPSAPVLDKRFVENLHRREKRWIHLTRGVSDPHGVHMKLECV